MSRKLLYDLRDGLQLAPLGPGHDALLALLDGSPQTVCLVLVENLCGFLERGGRLGVLLAQQVRSDDAGEELGSPVSRAGAAVCRNEVQCFSRMLDGLVVAADLVEGSRQVCQWAGVAGSSNGTSLIGCNGCNGLVGGMPGIEFA